VAVAVLLGAAGIGVGVLGRPGVAGSVGSVAPVASAASAVSASVTRSPSVTGRPPAVAGVSGLGAQPDSLRGVTCVGSTECVAVGYVGFFPAQRTLVEMWDGSAWSIVASPSPGDSSYLASVACSGPSWCVAVGNQVGAREQTLVESWSGGAWTVVPTPDPPGYDSALNAVSCTGADRCVAVGQSDLDRNDRPPTRTLVESWNGSVWSVVPSPSPGDSYDNLEGVSCAGPSTCVAVGASAVGLQSARPLQEAWDGTTWTVVPGPVPGGGEGALNGVDCTSTSACVAVGGQIDDSGSQTTLVESWNGTAWSLVPSPDPAVGADLLIGVSCAGPASCVATGFSIAGDGPRRTLVESWNGVVWSVVPSPDAGPLDDQLDAVGCADPTTCVAVGEAFTPPGFTRTLVESWNGAVWSPEISPNGSVLVAPAVGITATPSGDGYWIADESGDVVARGAAHGYGSLAPGALGAPVVGVVGAPDGRGYWLVASDGGVFAFGSARFLGSMGGTRLAAPVVGMAAAPDGRGYWLVASDGGVFAFGSARFLGSMGGHHLDRPVVGVAADAATGGYWLVASDGGVFAFRAPYLGSTGGLPLVSPVVALTARSDGRGYVLAAADGGVVTFGAAPFHGSMGGRPLVAPVVGLALDPSTGGYWLVGADGGVFAFAAPFDGAG
jgi:hypothetical protein